MTILSLTISRCMCPAENPGCRDQPFTILYRVMDMVSGRSVPSDIFQMQATTRYPGAYYIFQIKSGNEGREFYMRVSLVLTEGKHGVSCRWLNVLIAQLSFSWLSLKYLMLPSVWGIFYIETCRAVSWSARTAGSLRRVTYPKQTCFSHGTVDLGKPRAVPMSKNSSGLPSLRETIVPNWFLFDGQSTIFTKRFSVSCLFY